MKRTILILILLLTATSFTQAQWEKLPLYGGHAWKLVQSKFNPDDIFAITERSGVWYSSDGGNNWRPINGRNNELVHQEVKDLEVGRDNTIFLNLSEGFWKSTNLGMTWERVSLPENFNLVSSSVIKATSDGYIYVVVDGPDIGEPYTLIKSRTPGSNWIFVNLPENIDYRFSDIYVVRDDDRIFLYGYEGFFAVSSDGGMSWKEPDVFKNYGVIKSLSVFWRQGVEVYSIWGFDLENASGPFWYDYFESTDQGLTWTRKNVDSIKVENRIRSSNPSSVFYKDGTLSVVLFHSLYQSRDDGRTWIKKSDRTMWGLVRHGDKFISSYTMDGIITSSDLGLSWQPAQSMDQFSAFSRIEFKTANATTFFTIVGDAESFGDRLVYELRQSTDAGKTWTPLFRSNSLANLRVTSEPEIRYYCMHDENVVLRGGLNQTVPDTILTWPKSLNPTLIEMQKFSLKLSPVQPNLVYISAATQGGRRLFHSTDGGDTWEENRMPPYVYNFFEIYPSQLHPPWVVGIGGPPFSTQLFGMGFWLTKDYGRTWRKTKTTDPEGLPYGLFSSDVLFNNSNFTFSYDYGQSWIKNDSGIAKKEKGKFFAQYSPKGLLIVARGNQWYQFYNGSFHAIPEAMNTNPGTSVPSCLDVAGNDLYTGYISIGLFRLRGATITTVRDNLNNMKRNVVYLQSYPNPMTDRVYIQYSIPKGMEGRLMIMDYLGRKIRYYYLQPSLKRSTVVWNARDETGSRVPSGIYFINLNCETQTITRMLLVQ